jgi:hypothetical protein
VTAHVQAYRVSAPTLTRAQLVLLEGAGEEELTRFVKARAKVHDWCGHHVRDSDGVMESVHTLRQDGYCDGLGVPDWYFWHETLGQSFWAELKGVGGRLMPHQKERIASMRKAGTIVMVWWPRDGQTIEHTFRYGLGANA